MAGPPWFDATARERAMVTEVAPGGGGDSLPIADATGYRLDTTTYDNPNGSGGKIAVMVFPADAPQGAQVVYAMALEGDAFPRLLQFANPINAGIDMGDGTTDPWNDTSAGWAIQRNGDGTYWMHFVGAAAFILGAEDSIYGKLMGSGRCALRLRSDSEDGGDAAAVLSGDAAPVCGGNVGDVYIRRDGGDGSWLYRCTVAGQAGIAVWAAKL